MSKCLLCGQAINQALSLAFLMNFKPYRQSVICQKCKAEFKRISKQNCCRDCSKVGDFKASICSDCRRWRRKGLYFHNHGLYQYNLMMSQYMRRYKFQGDYRLRKVFQEEFSRWIRGMKRLVVPIPIHRDTYQRRGFNQVTGLLRSVKVVEALRTKQDQKTRPQSSKNREARLLLKQPFRVESTNIELIKGHDVAVVDDVYTTGTTIRHAAKLLKRSGAVSVIGITLAR